MITDFLTEFDNDINKFKEFKELINKNSNDDYITSYIQELIDCYPETYFTCDSCNLLQEYSNNYCPPCDYCDFAYCDNCSTMTFRTRPCYRDNCVDCEQEQCYFLRPERICSYCLGHKHP